MLFLFTLAPVKQKQSLQWENKEINFETESDIIKITALFELFMGVLLNGLSILAKSRVTITVLHDRKNDVTFWLLMVGD